MLSLQQVSFFNGFSNFETRSGESPQQAFHRLANVKGWVEGSTIFNALWMECLGYPYLHATLQNGGASPSVAATHRDLDNLMERLHITTSNASVTTTNASGLNTPSSSSSDRGVSIRYFDTFDGFEPDNAAPLRREFERLAAHQHWDSDGKMYKSQFVRCCAEEFRHFGGQEANKLQVWQSLCSDLGITPVPESLTKCKKALAKKFINIFDYVDCKRAENSLEPIFTSKTKTDFLKRTRKNLFPMRAAKKNPFLKVLLEVIFGAQGSSK